MKVFFIVSSYGCGVSMMVLTNNAAAAPSVRCNQQLLTFAALFLVALFEQRVEFAERLDQRSRQLAQCLRPDCNARFKPSVMESESRTSVGFFADDGGQVRDDIRQLHRDST